MDKEAIKELAARELARRNYSDFIQYTNPNYQLTWFHKLIADTLQDAINGKYKKLLITVPPQHGKSELSTRNLPAYILGVRPTAKIAVAAYSFDLARKFNRDIQRVLDNNLYSNIFPNTSLNSKNVSTDSRLGALRNSEMFEVVNYGGFVKTVGRGGGLTGTPVDIGIIDDPFKDRAEAQSLTIRESAWNWYTDVFESRLHNGSIQIMVLTRWHEDDIAGRALKRDKGEWKVIKLPAIKEGDINDYDFREEGEVLWEERHSLERMLKIKENSPITFNSLYQQNPKPSKEALVFPNTHTIDEIPKYVKGTMFIDFGFSNSPTAIGRLARDGMSIYMEELFYERGKFNKDIDAFLKSINTPKNELIICDSARPDLIADLKNNYGWVGVVGVHKQDVNSGIQFLNSHKLYITSKSVNWLNEAANYQYVMNGGVATNDTIKQNDHLWDGARYVCYFHYMRAKKAIRTIN